jgi:kynurenine formamidase
MLATRRRGARLPPRRGRLCAQAWTFGEHSGIHLDAPWPLHRGRPAHAELDSEELFAPVAVIDIARRAASNSDAQSRCAICAPTSAATAASRATPQSSSTRAGSGGSATRRCTATPGSNGRFHFPGFDLDAVEWLLELRQIQAIGVDTLSLDIGASTTFDVNRSLPADHYGLENLVSLTASRHAAARRSSALSGGSRAPAARAGPRPLVICEAGRYTPPATTFPSGAR